MGILNALLLEFTDIQPGQISGLHRVQGDCRPMGLGVLVEVVTVSFQIIHQGLSPGFPFAISSGTGRVAHGVHFGHEPPECLAKIRSQFRIGNDRK